MFAWTDTEITPWTVVKSNARSAPGSTPCAKYSASSTTETRTTTDVVGQADPLIVGRALAE